jgi:hypothetical protein
MLAQTAPALAAPEDGDRQEQADRPSRAEMAHDRPQRDGGGPRGGAELRGSGDRGEDRSQRFDSPRGDGGGRGEWRGGGDRVREAPRPPEAPQAVPAPRPPEPRADRGARVPGDSIGRPGPWVGQNRGAFNDGDRGRGDDRRGDDRRGDDRRGDDRRGDDRRDGGGRWNDDGRRPDRPDGDRGGWDRRDHDWRCQAGDWRDRDHRNWDRRNWDRGRDEWRNEARRWSRDRYPPVYFSSHRYRSYWRPPVGFYVRTWAFGDFLPRGWYGAQYYIDAPWYFDLPLPPPGFEWVRVGYDALLIDEYSVRVVQVVRNVFW